MDDALRRLGAVESIVGDLRGDVRHLATKAELKEEAGGLRAEMNATETRLVKAMGDMEARLLKAMGDMEARFARAMGDMDTRLSTQIASMDGRIIKWLIATTISSVGAAVAVSKLLS